MQRCGRASTPSWAGPSSDLPDALDVNCEADARLQDFRLCNDATGADSCCSGSHIGAPPQSFSAALMMQLRV